LPKKEDPKNIRLYMWLKLFKAKTKDDLQKIKNLGDPIMTESVDKLLEVLNSDKFASMIIARNKAIITENAVRHYERAEGIAKGKAEATAEATKEIAVKLLKMGGIDRQMILQVSGLSEEEFAAVEKEVAEK
jgi:hypothetical protein